MSTSLCRNCTCWLLLIPCVSLSRVVPSVLQFLERALYDEAWIRDSGCIWCMGWMSDGCML